MLARDSAGSPEAAQIGRLGSSRCEPRWCGGRARFPAIGPLLGPERDLAVAPTVRTKRGTIQHALARTHQAMSASRRDGAAAGAPARAPSPSKAEPKLRASRMPAVAESAAVWVVERPWRCGGRRSTFGRLARVELTEHPGAQHRDVLLLARDRRPRAMVEELELMSRTWLLGRYRRARAPLVVERIVRPDGRARPRLRSASCRSRSPRCASEASASPAKLRPVLRSARACAPLRSPRSR